MLRVSQQFAPTQTVRSFIACSGFSFSLFSNIRRWLRHGKMLSAATAVGICRCCDVSNEFSFHIFVFSILIFFLLLLFKTKEDEKICPSFCLLGNLLPTIRASALLEQSSTQQRWCNLWTGLNRALSEWLDDNSALFAVCLCTASAAGM